MKTVIIGAFLALSFSAQAMNLTCGFIGNKCSQKEGGIWSGSAGDHTILGGSLFMLCKLNGTDKEIEVSIGGAGPGLRYDKATAVNIFCPSMGKKKFLETYGVNNENVLYGVDLNVSAGVGPKIGVFADNKGRTCIVTGINLGAGASASISHLDFSMNPPSQSQCQQRSR